MPISSSILAGLYAGAKHFVEAVKSVLNSGGYPSGDKERNYVSIQESISTEPAQMDGDGKAHINVVVDLDKAPYGGAYEFGSGIHATQGKVGKYRIPKEGGSGKLLVFPWNPPDNPTGRTIWTFTKVEHPGVEAKPYLRPTLTKEADKIVELIGKEFEAAIMLDVLGESGAREERFVVKI